MDESKNRSRAYAYLLRRTAILAGCVRTRRRRGRACGLDRSLGRTRFRPIERFKHVTVGGKVVRHDRLKVSPRFPRHSTELLPFPPLFRGAG